MLNLPVASFDLETTGADKDRDEIVQLAVVRRDAGGSQKTISYLVRPRVPIGSVAAAVHGVTEAMVQDAPDFADLADEIHTALSDCVVTGYNIKAFDIPILQRQFRECGIEWPSPGAVIADAFEVHRAQNPHTLSNALEIYTGRRLGDDAHDATADAQAALEVHMAQCERHGIADVKTHARMARRPEWVDPDGKLKRVGPLALINFGQHSGTPLAEVPASYLGWILSKDFSDEVRQACSDELTRRNSR